MMMRIAPLLRALLLLLLLASCGDRPAGNPASLWVYFSGREVDLVLVDYAPPPF